MPQKTKSEQAAARQRRGVERKELMKKVAAKDKAVAERNKPKPPRTKNKAQLEGYCGAKKRKVNPGESPVCRRGAGWGTEHPGVGRCKYHGGATKNALLSSYREDAIFMGAEKEINPYDAIMWCIRVKAGEVEWLSEQMKVLDEEDWIEDSIFGKQMHLWQRERTAAIELLAKISKDAVALGIAERAVRLAESYGASIARLLKGIHDDLQLTAAQSQAWPQIVRRHLILIETTQVISGPAPANRQLEAAK